MPAAPTPTAFSSERRSEGSEPILIAIDSLWFMDTTPPDNNLPDTAWGAEQTPSFMMDPRRGFETGRPGLRAIGVSESLEGSGLDFGPSTRPAGRGRLKALGTGDGSAGLTPPP